MTSTKILIVDDELIMRESLAGWLERDGHQVKSASSGEEALELLEDTRYDIWLVDIKMEGISGLEVLRRVKESDPDVAVVMITAYGSIPTAIEAMKHGAHDYLLKPFDPNELGVLNPNLLMFHALYTLKDRAYHIPEREVIVFYSRNGSRVTIYDIVAAAVPRFSEVYPYLANEDDAVVEFLFPVDTLGLEEIDWTPYPDNNAHVSGPFELEGSRFLFPLTAHA